MKKYCDTFVLNEKNIDSVSLSIFEYLSDKKYLNESKISSRIAVETILQEWMERGGKDKTVEIKAEKYLGRLHIYLLLSSDIINLPDTKENLDFLNILENNLSATISVKFASNTNIADIMLPRQNVGSLGKIILAFVFACIFGNLLPLLFSSESLSYFSQNYIGPAISAIIGILGGFATIQIFFSILESILNMGNVTVFKNTGSKYLLLIFGTTIITTVISSIIMLSVCPVISMDVAKSNSDVNTIYKLLIDVIPTNVIRPFLEGNMLQVVFLGAFLGTILLAFRNEVAVLGSGISALNKTFMQAITILSKLMPCFVFLSILSFFLNNQIKLVWDSWLLLFVHALCCLISAVIMLALASIYGKTNFFSLIAKCLPVLGVGFSTASTIMTVPSIKKVLEDLGVNENTSKFSINLGYVFSRQTSCLVTMSIITCYYSILGKTMNPGEFTILCITSMVLAVAAPSVPGGGAALIAGIMAQFGLPVEIVAVVLSLDYIMDMTTTGTGCVCMTAEGIMLDRMI